MKEARIGGTDRPAYALALAAMLFAAAMQWLSLAAFDSLALSFLLYTLAACVLIPALDLRYRQGIPWRGFPAALGLSPFPAKARILALVLGLAMVGAMFAAFFLLEPLLMRGSRAVEVVRGWGIDPGMRAWTYFGVLVLNGGTEELFWRGYIHRLLAPASRRALALSLPALVFGGQHWFVVSRLVPDPAATALFMAGIVGSGFLWGIIRERTGSLAACVLCHMLVAAGYLSLLGLFLFRS